MYLDGRRDTFFSANENFLDLYIAILYKLQIEYVGRVYYDAGRRDAMNRMRINCYYVYHSTESIAYTYIMVIEHVTRVRMFVLCIECILWQRGIRRICSLR